jgi:acyl-CoA thioesterase-2
VSEAEAASEPDMAMQLASEPAGPDTYRFRAARSGPSDGLFGGQVLALALRAAGMTVDRDRLPHSLHAYFLRRGSSAKDIVLKLERATDGRSFSARRVSVLQDDLSIFSMTASFHVEEDGPDEQVGQLPDNVPDPESLPASAHSSPYGLLEVRNIETSGPGMPHRAWARASGRVGEDPLLHACVLAYFSDRYSGLPPLPGTQDYGGPSLDHALWFHRSIRLDDWVLISLEPVSASRGRGVYRGAIWDRAGTLGATLVQERLYSTSRRRRLLPQLEASGDPDQTTLRGTETQ